MKLFSQPNYYRENKETEVYLIAFKLYMCIYLCIYVSIVCEYIYICIHIYKHIYTILSEKKVTIDIEMKTYPLWYIYRNLIIFSQSLFIFK